MAVGYCQIERAPGKESQAVGMSVAISKGVSGSKPIRQLSGCKLQAISFT